MQPISQKNDGVFSFRLMAITMTAAMGGFLFGFDSSIINGTVDAVQETFSLSPSILGFTVSIALLGAMVGAWYGGACSHRWGRIKTMVVAAILLSVSALGTGIAFYIWDLILWRFIGGIGVGVASVIAPAYIVEVSPANLRGRLGTLQLLAIVIGIFLALLVSALIVELTGGANATGWLGLAAWRWMFLSELIPALLYGGLALMLPESPRYLVSKNRISEASQILSSIVGISDAKANQDKIAAIRSTIQQHTRASWRDIKDSRYIFIPIVWVGILLSVFQQFVGINVIFYYSTTLWRSVGFQESDSFLISVFMATTNIFATLIAISLIDHIGRKKLLMIGSAIMFLSLTCMAIAFAQAAHVDGELTLPSPWGAIALVAANFFIIGFGASWGPAVWVLLAEMFSNRIRAMALGLGAAMQWLANFVVSMSFPLLAEVGLQYAYGMYAGFAGLSGIFVYIAVRETNRCQLEDMEDTQVLQVSEYHMPIKAR